MKTMIEDLTSLLPHFLTSSRKHLQDYSNKRDIIEARNNPTVLFYCGHNVVTKDPAWMLIHLEQMQFMYCIVRRQRR